MTIKLLLVAAVGTVAVASSVVAAEAPRSRANLANVRWQDDPTEMWGVATVYAKTANSTRVAAATGGPVTTDDHDRGRNPGPPPGPPPRRRPPPGPRSPHK